MSILVCSLCRNEMGRYLTKVVPIWQEFADEILVVDDRSTDGSKEYLVEQKCRVFDNYGDPMMGAEYDIRQYLWDLATQTKHDILFWLDADMYPASDPSEILLNDDSDAFAFRYYDLWGDWEYRDDPWWSAHERFRVWAIRNPGQNEYKLPKRGWHSGHIPMQAVGTKIYSMPKRYSLMHLAYATEEGRKKQYAKYALLQMENVLTPAEWEHAQTILDPSPNVLHIPFTPEYHVEP